MRPNRNILAFIFLVGLSPLAFAEDKIPLSINTREYPHVKSISQGTIEIPECRISYSTFSPVELIRRFESGAAGDVIEVDLISFMKRFASEEKHDWVLVPVFLWREFPQRHVVVKSTNPIVSLSDLAGHNLGVDKSNVTLAVWARGILESSAAVKDLALMWDPSLSTSSARLERVYTDSKTVEQEYFRETRIFPVLTALAVRHELVLANPWLPEAIFLAFSEAKAQALESGTLPLPWGEEHREETISLMHKSYWSYGVKNNPKTLGALFKYAFEQQVISKEIEPEDIFAPETLQLIDDKGAKN